MAICLSHNFDKIINDNGVDKLETIDIEINGYAINGELEHKTLLMPLYHELNHAIENYERLKKYYKGETSEKGLYDKLEKIKYNDKYNLYNNATDDYDESMGLLLYIFLSICPQNIKQ